MFKKIVIGGTFDPLHSGHEKLLRAAFDVGERVIIGLTSDEFAERFRTRKTSGYGLRAKAVEKFIRKIGGGKYNMVRIDDSYGPATTDPELDCIVVSEETLLRAEEINAIRFKKGLEKLAILVVPLMLAKDGRPISSERILEGEIDPEGNVL